MAFINKLPANGPQPYGILTASTRLAAGAAFVFFLSLTSSAFGADGSDTPSAISPAQQAYSAYQKGDFETAKTLWKKLAARGDAPAQYNLGLIYSEGRGVTRNPQAAIKWWQLAAENGHVLAQHNLALALISGETAEPGVAKEPRLDAAIAWLRKAAKSGLAPAQDRLAAMYQTGDFIAGDKVEALAWASLASTSGLVSAVERRDALLHQMSASEVDRAKARAKELLAD